MQELAPLIWEVADQLKLVERTEVECCGVTPYQGFILMKLLARDGMPMQVLAGTLNVAVSTMTRNVDKLEEKSLIHRVQAPQDARSYGVYLTEAGRETARRIQSSWDDYFLRLKNNMTEEEQQQVLRGMQILLSAVRRSGACCE